MSTAKQVRLSHSTHKAQPHTCTLRGKHKCVCVCWKALSAHLFLRSPLLSGYPFIGKRTPQCLILHLKSQTISVYGPTCSGFSVAQLVVNKKISQIWRAMALPPFLTIPWIRNHLQVSVDKYSRSPFNTSRPGPQSTACVKRVQLEMCGNMCTPWCLFVVTGWTTSGWKWPVIWVRSLGIYEALKCLVSGEGGLAAVAQAGGRQEESPRQREQRL